MSKELRKLLKDYNASEHPYDAGQFSISIQDLEDLLQTETAFIVKSLMASNEVDIGHILQAIVDDLGQSLSFDLATSKTLISSYLNQCVEPKGQP